MRIGIVQLTSGQNKEKNLSIACEFIGNLAVQGAELAVLPEYANFYGSQKYWKDAAEEMKSSPSLDRLRECAVSREIAVHCGSFLERDGEKVFNTSVVFDRAGNLLAKYRKIHLFDAVLPSGRIYRESDSLNAGNKIVTFTLNDVRFGMATCYDLRFPELFQNLAQKGAQVFILPAAFTSETGRDHWEVLLRARAIENSVYMVAAGQYGNCARNVSCYGRSMVVDPWGLVLAQLPDGIGRKGVDINWDPSCKWGLVGKL